MNNLVIIAHPDDHTFFCTGTIAKWIEKGDNVYMICVTNGNLGSLKTGMTLEKISEIREKELLKANSLLKIKETILLGYPDGGFIDASTLREQLIYYIRKLEIDRVITFDPWVQYEVHPDHVIVGRMGAEAGCFSSFPLLYPNQLDTNISPYRCSEIWFMGMLGHSPNVFVDISQTINKRIDAALCFENTLALISKLFTNDIEPGDITSADFKRLTKYAEEFHRNHASKIGKAVGLEVAEAFYVQGVLPGHLDNLDEMLMESLGDSPPPPKIY